MSIIIVLLSTGQTPGSYSEGVLIWIQLYNMYRDNAVGHVSMKQLIIRSGPAINNISRRNVYLMREVEEGALLYINPGGWQKAENKIHNHKT